MARPAYVRPKMGRKIKITRFGGDHRRDVYTPDSTARWTRDEQIAMLMFPGMAVQARTGVTQNLMPGRTSG